MFDLKGNVTTALSLTDLKTTSTTTGQKAKLKGKSIMINLAGSNTGTVSLKDWAFDNTEFLAEHKLFILPSGKSMTQLEISNVTFSNTVTISTKILFDFLGTISTETFVMKDFTFSGVNVGLATSTDSALFNYEGTFTKI